MLQITVFCVHQQSLKTKKHSSDLSAIISKDAVDLGHDIHNILVCRVQYLETALLMSPLVILKLQVPKVQ